MKNINLSIIQRPIKLLGVLTEKYHITIITVVVVGVLIAVVANVNGVLSQPPDESYRESTQKSSLPTRFDEATIESINNLRQRQESSSLNLPAGRNSPFTE